MSLIYIFNPFTGNLDISLGNIPTSVSNTDGTLTISPTTGSVVASRAAITGDVTIAAASNTSVLVTAQPGLHTWALSQTFTSQSKFANGTVSLPGIAYSGETSTGFYRTGTGVMSLALSGSQLMQFDGTSNTASGYITEAHVSIITNDASAGGNVKGAFNIRNQGYNTYAIAPRHDFNIQDVFWGNPTNEGYVRIFSDQYTNIGRLDINYLNAFLGGDATSITNFRGAFIMPRLGDATSNTNMFTSGSIAFQPSIWTGTVSDGPNFFMYAQPNNGQNNKYFFGMTGQSAGGYIGFSFGIQSNNWRTQSFSDNIGINNSDPAAHIDIVEDSSARIIMQMKGASSQSGDYLSLLDSSNNKLWSLSKDGTIIYTVVTKTATYSILTTDKIILLDAAIASFTATLPTAVGCTGQVYTIKKTTAGNVVTIATTSAQTIDGVTTYTMRAQYDTLQIISDGANWQMLDKRAGLTPIGGMIPWAKTFTGTPSIPAEFLEANGQTVSDTSSPYNGTAVPNPNSNQQVLRGNTTSGGTGGSISAGHSHSVTTTGGTVSAGTGGTVSFVASVSNNVSSAQLTYTDPYYDVVFIIRIK